MASKKTLLYSAVGLLVLVGGFAWHLHMKSVRQAQQHEQAMQLLSAVTLEGENCLKKLAGRHGDLNKIKNTFSTKISSCYLQHVGVEASNVSKDACLGLTREMSATDSFQLASVQVNGSDLAPELCKGDTTLQFELKTTPAGKAFYEKERAKNQSDVKDEVGTVIPTAERLADTNAFPEEIIDRLSQAAPTSNTRPKRKNDTSNPVIIAEIVSVQKTDNKNLYEWTVSYKDDGSVHKIIQDNSLRLKPDDSVVLILENGRLQIRNKLNAY